MHLAMIARMVSDKRGMAQRMQLHGVSMRYLIWYCANVLRLLGHLQQLEHSNSDDIAHDFVAFRREMQAVIPEPFA